MTPIPGCPCADCIRERHAGQIESTAHDLWPKHARVEVTADRKPMFIGNISQFRLAIGFIEGLMIGGAKVTLRKLDP